MWWRFSYCRFYYQAGVLRLCLRSFGNSGWASKALEKFTLVLGTVVTCLYYPRRRCLRDD